MAKRLRRTPKELKQFREIVKGYESEGAPKWYAEQCAWDVLLLERQIRRGNIRDKVSA